MHPLLTIERPMSADAGKGVVCKLRRAGVLIQVDWCKDAQVGQRLGGGGQDRR